MAALRAMGKQARIRRSFFYVPGSSVKMLNKSTGLGADSLVLDLEDGVADCQKEQARHNVMEALNGLHFGKSERLVRVNPVSGPPGFYKKDVQAVCESKVRPDGLVLPKVEHASELEDLQQLTSSFNCAPFPVIGIVETARGMVNLPAIAQHSSLQGLVFGADDFAADMGAIRSRAGQEVFWARNWMLLHCTVNGLQSIDMVHIDLSDDTHFLQECQEGFALGYTGKQLVHPKQIGPAHAAFSPPPEKVAWAERVMAAQKENAAAGRGAFLVDGEMIDMPTIKQAQHILLRAGRG
eukprot:gb/GEZN01011475.1/.p1 GENE.gb/GEZN01011475.1/~~gb/GEZN01011475.1/.p1  ORF type:complete len:295 (+),score=61.26 gb/GEZN01011475.1/:235-1119(+)